MRVALYARYSSDQQREASLEDQFRVCRALAQRSGWTVVESLSDHAISGATLDRLGLKLLEAAIIAGRIDIVVAESLDRLSRDLEHPAAFHKRCGFYRVRIYTAAEGEISLAERRRRHRARRRRLVRLHHPWQAEARRRCPAQRSLHRALGLAAPHPCQGPREWSSAPP